RIAHDIQNAREGKAIGAGGVASWLDRAHVELDGRGAIIAARADAEAVPAWIERRVDREDAAVCARTLDGERDASSAAWRRDPLRLDCHAVLEHAAFDASRASGDDRSAARRDDDDARAAIRSFANDDLGFRIDSEVRAAKEWRPDRLP